MFRSALVGKAKSTQRLLPIQYASSDRFLQDYAGQIVNDARIAVLEIIANAYDAGATQIDIEWPTETGASFSIRDNGLGLTLKEFEYRWSTLCYERAKEQGNDVVFPKGIKGIRRTAFGRSGKGRFAPLCFDNSYTVETVRLGEKTVATVEMAADEGRPFAIKISKVEPSEVANHGTVISGQMARKAISPAEILQLIGSKFIVDPSLKIVVNGLASELFDVAGLKSSKHLVDPFGEVEIHFIDSIEHARSKKLRGITFWTNRRRIGEPSWDQLDDEGAYLDGRTEAAKKFSFIVTADFLTPGTDIKADWTGFHTTAKVNALRSVVHSQVIQEIQRQLAGSRRDRKKAALEQSKSLVEELPSTSRNALGHFIDEVQEKCPTMSDRDLSRTVEVLAKLEQSRDGYDLLAQLASCSSNDLDTWNSLMQRWTASNAEIVLDELDRRLKLIMRMENLVENPLADELHDLQPLFERGLWIFGPEFESVDFRSNRGLTHIIRTFLGGSESPAPLKRPDFVALPESSIGVYCADSYDVSGEVAGIRKAAILELKKGGFRVTQKEMDQAREYAKELRRAGRIQPTTEIVAYVLGADLEDGLLPTKIGEFTHIIPMVYDTVLRKANQRTFNLQTKLRELEPNVSSDPEVEEVLRDGGTRALFAVSEL